MSRRVWVIALALAILCTGCLRATPGRRCRTTELAEDGGAWVLKCQSGRWVRAVTKADMLAILIRIKAAQAQAAANSAPAPSEPIAVVPTNAPVTTISVANEYYDIVIRPVAPLAPAVQAAFATAAARWSSVIVRGVPDLALPAGTPSCNPDAANLPTVVDDLIIDVQVSPIDGPGGVLGQAGPCYTANSDGLSRVGDMRFDSADVDGLLAGGLFPAVVLHEMGHVLGFGTLWDPQNSGLLVGAGTADPRFVGPRAMSEYSKLGGTGGVPVENTGGVGTADAHWRAAAFGDELMTGYLGVTPPFPLSTVTIASLADLGYQVNLSGADVFTLGAALRSAALRSAPLVADGTWPTMTNHGPRAAL